MSGLNKKVFEKLVCYLPESRGDGYIYTRRFSIDNYDYDYSHAIVKYIEASGCKIQRTNHNFFGGFYVYFTGATKVVDVDEFIEMYKGGMHYDSRTSGLIIFCIVAIIIALILLFLVTLH